VCSSDLRKHLLEYDDVMNKQRQEIYRFRRDLLDEQDQKEYILRLTEDILLEFLDTYAHLDMNPEEWDLENLKVNLKRVFAVDLPEKAGQLSRPELEEQLLDQVKSKYEDKEKDVGAEMMRWYERMVMLQIMDQQWKDHLLALDHLKEGIGLRGYGQRDPLVEYKRESFGLFEELWNRATEEMVRMLFLLRPIAETDERELLTARQRRQEVTYSGPEATSSAAFQPSQTVNDRTAAAVKTVVRNNPKVGRNDPCSCGSGKKYKKCCGR
jgi:preprotein translocase subunit SecA